MVLPRIPRSPLHAGEELLALFKRPAAIDGKELRRLEHVLSVQKPCGEMGRLLRLTEPLHGNPGLNLLSPRRIVESSDIFEKARIIHGMRSGCVHHNAVGPHRLPRTSHQRIRGRALRAV